MNQSTRAFRIALIALWSLSAAVAARTALAADNTPPPSPPPPQAAPGCLDLATYLGHIRTLPDALYMHHLLVSLSLDASDDSQPVSDLATQHALDLFYHPNLVTLGLAAAKNGGSYLHDFTAYQEDCAKVVTGDIFAAEGMSVIWEIVDHAANSVTLKRLTDGGNAEVSGDLKLVMRRFTALSPTVFAISSAYGLTTSHNCTAPATAADETDVASVTEIFVIDNSPQNPADQSNDALKALMAKYPRAAAPNGHRGDFVHPVTPQSDSACAAPAPAAPAAPAHP